MSKISLIILCTRKYDVFLQQFIDSAEECFFKGEPIDVYVLTDKPDGIIRQKQYERINIGIGEIPSYKFPFATLYRYKEITKFSDFFTSDYLFYSDIDMRFVAPVGEEILCEGLTAVRHPGFFRNNGWGSPKTHPHSAMYLNPKIFGNYYAGGFQGGRREEYLKCASILSELIDQDLDTARDMGYTANDGILTHFHDESAWNWYLKIMEEPKKVLCPAYCMVEQMELRKKWGIDNIPVKLVALAKDHKAIRS
jgi:histo-blood group ABO system transferase